MKCGAFIPRDLVIIVSEAVDTKRHENGTFEYVMKERQARVVFCDVLVHGDRVSMDQYYDANHAVSREITEIELLAIDGFDGFREGESAAMHAEVFGA